MSVELIEDVLERVELLSGLGVTALRREALVVVEVAAREELPAPVGFAVIDERVYGAARLVFLRYNGATGDER